MYWENIITYQLFIICLYFIKVLNILCGINFFPSQWLEDFRELFEGTINKCIVKIHSSNIQMTQSSNYLLIWWYIIFLLYSSLYKAISSLYVYNRQRFKHNILLQSDFPHYVVSSLLRDTVANIWLL